MAWMSCCTAFKSSSICLRSALFFAYLAKGERSVNQNCATDEEENVNSLEQHTVDVQVLVHALHAAGPLLSQLLHLLLEFQGLAGAQLVLGQVDGHDGARASDAWIGWGKMLFR